MAAHALFQKVKATVGGWIDTTHGKPKSEHPIIRYGTPVLFALLVLAALSALYVGYRWYATHREQHAQYACSMLIDEYMNLQKKETPDYETFAAKAATLYAQHKGTAVAPYIGLLIVDAHLKNDNQEKAIEVMDTLVDATAYNSIVGDLFKTKQALLMIDATDDLQKEEGLKRLAILADNSDNPHRDYALYHLGLYHWNKNDLGAARNAWQELVESQEVELRAPSPWAEVVAEKLSTIPA